MSIKTPWFDGSVKPDRVGVYERKGHKRRGVLLTYSYWDGKQWGLGSRFSPENAEGHAKIKSFLQNQPWRGLAQNPEEPKK